MVNIEHIANILENLAPLHYAEDYDNTGLLVGDIDREVTGVLVTLDTLEDMVDEAMEKNCNLIVSFHPIIFGGLKKLTGKSYVERAVIKAVKNDIAIYAVHTALDNAWNGVNAIICEKLGLENRQTLVPKTGVIKKLTTFVPKAEATALREVLFAAGAGHIGNYSHCSFNVDGQGSFRPEKGSNPTLGEHGQTHLESETQIGITFPAHLESKVLKTLFSSHSYEEVAYEVTTLDNAHQKLGLGMVGEWPKAVSEKEFFSRVAKTMKTGGIRHSRLLGKPVRKVAVLGGSGSFAIPQAIGSGADAYLTADLKYHDFFRAEDRIVLADIGHYESEQFTKNFLAAYLTEKITNFAAGNSGPEVALSERQTNPVFYYG